jgi:formate dehydrogenase subunit delta
VNAPYLADMANRIGQFFAAYPDPDEAADGIAQHIGLFWEARMRRQIYALLDGPDAARLEPLVAHALRRRRDRLLPAGAAAVPIPPAGQSEA